MKHRPFYVFELSDCQFVWTAETICNTVGATLRGCPFFAKMKFASQNVSLMCRAGACSRRLLVMPNLLKNNIFRRERCSLRSVELCIVFGKSHRVRRPRRTNSPQANNEKSFFGRCGHRPLQINFYLL